MARYFKDNGDSMLVKEEAVKTGNDDTPGASGTFYRNSYTMNPEGQEEHEHAVTIYYYYNTPTEGKRFW